MALKTHVYVRSINQENNNKQLRFYIQLLINSNKVQKVSKSFLF